MNARAQRVQSWFEWPLITAAVLVIPTIAIEQSDVHAPRGSIAVVLKWVIWTVFAAELARELGGTRAAVLHHLRALMDAGLAREGGSEPISGGLLRTYGAVGTGWAEAVATLNKLAEQ